MKRWLLFSVFAAILAVGSPLPTVAQGQTRNALLSDSDRVLKNLPGVAIVVEDLDKDAKATGLNPAILEKYTELKLRADGIKVLSPKASVALSDQPYIYLRLTVVRIPKSEVLIYSFDIKLDETLIRPSDQKRITGCTIWSQEYTGAVANKTFPTAIHDVLKGFLHQFTTAYNKENAAK